ncbi:nitrogenase-stabilizing/protective protein NifW [Paraburkholderia diazotrophica]|uniref:nitrogenase-stabilizing/protective protein NifW n=1 Tax=Paraburkholderia diazotrophica TaxID=667676 RepID=UPI000B8A311E|nr:nitrogenase-stabilizing/protective protein NifW [Paraburkholderia diazotrophica]
MQFFGIAFDQKVASVGRLHILRRFSPLPIFSATEAVPHDNATTLLTVCQRPRQHAYNNFVVSPPAAENVFKVLQGIEGHRPISLDNLQASLATCRTTCLGGRHARTSSPAPSRLLIRRWGPLRH